MLTEPQRRRRGQRAAARQWTGHWTWHRRDCRIEVTDHASLQEAFVLDRAVEKILRQTVEQVFLQVTAAFQRAEDQLGRAMEAVAQTIAPFALLHALLEAEDAEDSPPEVDYAMLVEEDKTIQESLALIAQLRARRST